AEDRNLDRFLADGPLAATREPGDDLVEEVTGAVPVQRRDGDRVAEAEAVELERLQVSSRIVELVGENEDGSTGRTQDVGELLVAGSHAGRRIDDEEDEVGLLHRLTRLRRDLWAERPGVGAVDAAGVDQAEGGARPVAEELLAVPCDAGRLVDDGRTRRCQAVYERRLADVGEADDRDRAGDLDVVGRLVHVGGAAARRRPTSWS